MKPSLQFLSIFGATFLYIFFITIQFKNVQHNDVIWAGLTSIIISAAHIVYVNGIVNKGWAGKAGYMIGAVSGVMSATYLGSIIYP